MLCLPIGVMFHYGFGVCYICQRKVRESAAYECRICESIYLVKQEYTRYKMSDARIHVPHAGSRDVYKSPIIESQIL